MKGDSLYDIVDFILNQASENDLEVVRAALKRRIEGSDMGGPMGVSPVRLARESAAKVRRQVGVSIERIRETVKQFASEIIRKNAPELTEEQVKELLDTWVPTEPGERPPRDSGEDAEGRPRAAGRPTELRDGRLPAEALMSMISQFVAYATEAMSITEQIRLRDEIPDWHKRYWEQFAPRVRDLISLHVGGQLDKATFWERVRLELGLE
jgi:hypothetical protein